jgi:hypothetical protein
LIAGYRCRSAARFLNLSEIPAPQPARPGQVPKCTSKAARDAASMALYLIMVARSRALAGVRPGELELLPKLMLRPTLPFSNRCENQQDSAIGKIGVGDDIFDPVENDGSGGRSSWHGC